MGQIEPMIHEDGLPGHESRLDPQPEWTPRYPGSGRLAGKVALVTGGDSGIGRAVAALFAREGADVAIIYLCEHDDAQQTAKIVAIEGRRAVAIAGDVGDKAFCERAVAEVVETLGGIDILVNNAGEQHPDNDITDISEEQLRRTFQTNIFGIFFMTQAARPHLKEARRSSTAPRSPVIKARRSCSTTARPRAPSPPSRDRFQRIWWARASG